MNEDRGLPENGSMGTVALSKSFGGMCLLERLESGHRECDSEIETQVPELTHEASAAVWPLELHGALDD